MQKPNSVAATARLAGLAALTSLTALSYSAGALAQSNVTVYGIVDVGIANERNGSPGTSNRIDSGGQSGSRLGFKGSEDLGNGLKANFVLENGINVDDGSLGQGALFGRQAWVGLSGGFGALNLGRQKAPFYDVMDKLDPFHIGLAGDANRLFKTTVRVNNAVTYFAPASNGFSGNVLYAFGETAGNARANRVAGFAVNYDKGPLESSVAYHQTWDGTGNDSAKKTLAGATWKFPSVKLHGAYEWNRGTGTLNTRVWLLGATVPVGGAGALLIDYTKVADRTVANADGRQIAVGFTWDLSKRTDLYTSYSRTSNDAKAKYNVLLNGATDRFFNAGIRHKF
jgi:predicted porin